MAFVVSSLTSRMQSKSLRTETRNLKIQDGEDVEVLRRPVTSSKFSDFEGVLWNCTNLYRSGTDFKQQIDNFFRCCSYMLRHRLTGITSKRYTNVGRRNPSLLSKYTNSINCNQIWSEESWNSCEVFSDLNQGSLAQNWSNPDWKADPLRTSSWIPY